MPKHYLPGPEPQTWYQQPLTTGDKRLISQTFDECILYRKLKPFTSRYFGKNCTIILTELAKRDV